MALLESIAMDHEGYLLNSCDWTKELAEAMAEQEQLELTGDHWEVIYYVRKFYLEFNTSPAIRPLVKYLGREWGTNKGNSFYLHQLFPNGPAKQAARLAGLPKPKRCI